MDFDIGAAPAPSVDMPATSDQRAWAGELLWQYFDGKDPNPNAKAGSESDEIIEDDVFTKKPVVDPQQVFQKAGPAQVVV